MVAKKLDIMDVRNNIANELHKQARRNYPRRKVTLKGLNDLCQCDLVEMLPYARFNKGVRYILTLIDCFTKFAYAVPVKNKTGVEVAKALEPILNKHKMKHLQSDKGGEFFNPHVKKLTVKYNINHYATFSDMKASIVERLNRTLKGKMWKMFTAKGNYEWLSILPGIVKYYNSSVHRTIGMRPVDVKRKHVRGILARISVNGGNDMPKFKVDDRVRISKYKRVFTKGYKPSWLNELFKIYAVKPTRPVTYILQDSRGEVIKGGFYEHELSLSRTGDVYLIEKVLKRRGDQVLVRWLGFDKTHDSWMDKRSLR